ncbi:MAG: HXXEE domain-containing protein [Candidatus Coproplasma sp.]
MNFLYWFVGQGWLYLMAGLGIFLTIWLATHWKKYDWLNRLGTLAIIVLVFHVFEEWVLPGGFHYIYNEGSVAPDRYPMNQLTDMITNLGGAIIGTVILLVWGLNTGAGIAISLFSLFEAVIHLVLANKSLSAFSAMGQTAFYAPGLNTALFGFLPIAITYLLYFIFHKKKPNWKQWLGGLISLVVLSFLLVNLPEMLLKDENSSFIFPDHGYYDQFINGTAQSGMSGATIATIILGCLLAVGLIGLCVYYFGVKKKKISDVITQLKSTFNRTTEEYNADA